jgi:hypothetical protein
MTVSAIRTVLLAPAAKGAACHAEPKILLEVAFPAVC